MSGIRETSKKPARFAFLNSTGECARQIYDEVLFEADDCVVVPTLGSIVPNWLLIVPRRPVLNFAEWSTDTDKSPFRLVQKVVERCANWRGETIWFEHGPTYLGSEVGCGVDQAHLHVICGAPFSAEQMRLCAKQSSGLNWSDCDPELIYSSVQPKRSYLIAGSLEKASLALDVERVGSQFFRRIVATLSRQPNAWNYRTHPHLPNVHETVRIFQATN